MKKAKPKPSQTKFQIVGELLKNFGNGLIDDERFWREMHREGFEQDAIDWWLEQDRAENGEKA